MRSENKTLRDIRDYAPNVAAIEINTKEVAASAVRHDTDHNQYAEPLQDWSLVVTNPSVARIHV